MGETTFSGSKGSILVQFLDFGIEVIEREGSSPSQEYLKS
jgi:hypothetical protein